MPSEQQLSIPGRLPTRDEKQAASAARPDGTSAPLATMADARPQTAGEGAEERRTAPRSARFAEPGPSRPVSTLLKRAWPALAWIGVFSFGLNLLMLVTAVYSLEVFDRVLSSGSHDTLVYLSVIAIAALATLGALDAARGRVLSGVGSWIDAELTPRTIEATLRSRLTGRAQSAQAMRDLGQVRQFIGGQPVLPLFDVWWIPLFIAVLFHMHAWLGWMTVAGALILLALTFLTEALTKKPLQDANRASIEAQMDLDAAIRNAELVQALGMLPRIVRRWADRNNDISAATDRVGRRQAVISGITKFVRLVIQVLIMGAGAALVLKGELTGGGMIAGSILLGRALAPIEQLIGAWRQFVTARTSLSRLEPLLASLPPAVRPTPLPMPSADLQVDRVSFAVPGTNRAVLKSVSFRATPGESIAIVGPSGAGKSTLCKLLCGIWPPATGSIRLDGAEVYAWHRPEFGQHLGYLPQEVELFQGTVRENIARLQDADPEEVIAAAMAADVHKLILQLPDGYDTPLGIGGVMLSGGQRQRIGLARALFRSPQLIVLDEPNSNLDMEGEQALIRAVETAKERGAVVIMVAHRPSSMGAIDKILVLRDGVVEQFGRRDEIMPKIAPVATPAANSAGAPVAAQAQTARVSSLPMDGRSRG